jgi:hypothetical protein
MNFKQLKMQQRQQAASLAESSLPETQGIDT